MKIELKNGQFALVDKEDYDQIKHFSWNAVESSKRTKKIYVSAHIGNGKNAYLHRFLLKPTADQHIDHINGNGLDNRRSNLRLANRYQNNWNSRKRPTWKGKKCSSPYKGVYVSQGAIRACIVRNGKSYYLGTFKTHESALEAYLAIAKKIDGEFLYSRLKEKVG